MSDIDVDAVTGKVERVVESVAARVERDVRQQIAADLMECAAKADAYRRTTFFESSQTRLAHMAETYRIAAQVARGGSDV